MSVGETFFLGASDSPEEAETNLSTKFADALAEKFPDSVAATPEPPEVPSDGAGGEVGDGSTPLEPASSPSTDAPAPAEVDPSGGPGEVTSLPGDAAPATDSFQISDDANAEPPVEGQTLAAAAPSPTPNEINLNEVFTRWNGGNPVSQEQLVGLLTFVGQVNQLTPQQQQELSGWLNPQFAPPATPSAPTYQAPAVDQTPAAPAFDLPADLAPEARALLEPILHRQQALEAQVAEQQRTQYQANYQQQMAQIQQGSRIGSEEFVNTYKDHLSPTDMVLLESKVASSGQFPYFLQQAQGNAAVAYRQMLEAAVFADPEMAGRVTQSRLAAEARQQAIDAARQQKAASVAGGGAAPKQSPARGAASSGPAPTKQEMIKAAAAEVAAATGLQGAGNPR